MKDSGTHQVSAIVDSGAHHLSANRNNSAANYTKIAAHQPSESAAHQPLALAAHHLFESGVRSIKDCCAHQV